MQNYHNNQEMIIEQTYNLKKAVFFKILSQKLAYFFILELTCGMHPCYRFSMYSSKVYKFKNKVEQNKCRQQSTVADFRQNDKLIGYFLSFEYSS